MKDRCKMACGWEEDAPPLTQYEKKDIVVGDLLPWPPAVPELPLVVVPEYAHPFLMTSKRKCLGAVLHCSASKDSKAKNFDALKKDHIKNRHWKDIGYHAVIEYVGENIQVLKGRDPNTDGAHAIGYNKTHLGICVVGDFDTCKPPAELWGKTLEVVKELSIFYGFSAENVLGHRETYEPRGVKISKTCPGKLWNMKKFRLELARRLDA